MDWWNNYMSRAFAEKGRGAGDLDCWGLVHAVYADILGITLPDYLEVYETTEDREILGRVIGEESGEKWLTPESPKEFDVIILRLRGVPMHVGLVTKPGYMLHCAKGVGVAHERFDSLKWRNNVMGFARHGSIESIRGTATV